MRSTGCTAFVAVAVALSLLTLIDAANTGPKPKVKKPKPVNWSLPYYSKRFDLCKKMRVFNPVELVKAQAWAADVFRRCVPKLVIAYGTKYNFPAYGIESVARFMCYAVNFGYAFFARDGTLFIESDVRTSNFLKLAEITIKAVMRAMGNFTVKYRGRKEKFSLEIVCGFSYSLMKCAFSGDVVTQLDGDVVKHAIEHGKFMLL